MKNQAIFSYQLNRFYLLKILNFYKTKKDAFIMK